jgi:ketosteroid isomerase-like protein
VSQENVEIVRVGFDAFIRGDVPSMLDFFASDVVVTLRPDQPDVRDYHGHEGVIQQLDDWMGMWDDYSIEPLRVRDVDDVVIVVSRQRGLAKQSRVPIDDEVTLVFTVGSAKKVVRWQMFGSEREALQDVGLGE